MERLVELIIPRRYGGLQGSEKGEWAVISISGAEIVNDDSEVKCEMSIVITLLILLVPPCMLIMAWLFASMRVIFHALAVGCAYVFAIISALAVYEIIRDETVFMTNIHAVFANNYFLITGGYLGYYGIYILLKWMLLELRSED
ncbi:hypothetical protein HQN90_24845 [Paenibacillus alba]|uniref:hypothetical protein n=1 Tax=Paenibacillus alba TaxID=1197127 RepID=UPI001565F32C|nr:hypothetical protein [Paenibacillus alba]NQX69368.1 hypothetical protein [Paenibacillus alba]